MPKESRHQKALRYIAEERVTVTYANAYGIRLEVRGSRAEPYEVAYGLSSRERPVATCTCACPKACAHLEVAKLLHRI